MLFIKFDNKSTYKCAALIMNYVYFQGSNVQIQGKWGVMSITMPLSHDSLLKGRQNILDILVIFPLIKIPFVDNFPTFSEKNKMDPFTKPAQTDYHVWILWIVTQRYLEIYRGS